MLMFENVTKVRVSSGVSWYDDDLRNYSSPWEILESVDEWIGYTQANVDIMDGRTGEIIAMRRWYGVPLDEKHPTEEYPIDFGEEGYYGDWQDMSGEKLIDKWI